MHRSARKSDHRRLRSLRHRRATDGTTIQRDGLQRHDALRPQDNTACALIEKPPRRSPAGFVLPAVVFALVVMSVISVVTLRTADNSTRSVRSFRESGLALIAADAGLRQTLGNWPSGVSGLHPGDSLPLDWATLPDGGKYRAVIYQVDNGGMRIYTIVVQGRGPGNAPGQRTIEAVVADMPRFEYGVVALDSLRFGGTGGGADSYDSDNGAYNAATADSAANMQSNGKVILNDATVIKGRIKTSATSNAVGSAIITGGLSAGAPPIVSGFDTLACPSGGYTPAGDVPSSPSVTYNPMTGALAVGAGANITLSGASYYFRSVDLSGGATMTFSGASRVDVWVDSVLNVTSGAIVNQSAKPTNLSIWACGTSSSAKWTITGGGGAHMTIYAPRSEVWLAGGGEFWGAVVSKFFNNTGGSTVHYDKSLKTGFGSLRIIAGSWTELPLY